MSISRVWRIAVALALAALTAGQWSTVSSNPPLLSPTMPGDVAVNADAAAIDKFSWQSFVAVNWPTNNSVIGQGGDHTAFFQSWKADTDVLVPDGQVPIPFKTPSPIPADCMQTAPPGTRILTQDTKFGKRGDFKTPGNGPLIDQNGEYVRFEILVNEPMYDFIVSNKLYSKAGQMAYNPNGEVVFPAGVINGAPGAVMLKLSWKIMGNGDDPKRFHTAMAYLYNPASTPKCQLKLVGLVGMHISHKTVNAPQWVWSTFEHVANAPLVGSVGGEPFSFNDGTIPHRSLGCNGKSCNLKPSGNWDPNSGVKTPVQVARLIDFTKTAKAQNAIFETALLAVDTKSVFANYRLVGTQFPSDVTDQNDPAGAPLPRFLANSTMETFLQGHTPNNSSSCAGCHYQSSMPDGRLSDFSFILARVEAQ